MDKKEVVQKILSKVDSQAKESASAFAPVNIALVKYWGKRNQELNLPVTSSLSKSLQVGTHTKISFADGEDIVWLNHTRLSENDPFTKRLRDFCSLFRPTPHTFFHINTTNEIPTGAGLASSASGFAATVCALNELFGWNLEKKELSILARMGSGSACRSIYEGFVEWHAGTREDGFDSFATPLDIQWSELKLGLWIISGDKKSIDSREAMRETVRTSSLYGSWPEKVASDLIGIKEAIALHDFARLGTLVESNCLAMHATMMASQPPILYWLPETVRAMQQVWQWRKEGLSVYFTMDAGPNLKLLFLDQDRNAILNLLPTLQIVS